ncbi:T9SS type A sorting domain-containing protein [candidate division WOR-3 bacterium]|nr:T9SS type A sorting domain-containing protein [candidate division WOR-3 bacterium]
MKRSSSALLVCGFGFCVLATCVWAQNYRCDWSVIGIGGGDVSSAAYRCGSTAGQTAVGTMTGTSYNAFIGFWQIEEQVGLEEVKKGSRNPVAETRLYSPAPNPARSHVAIRYSLAVNGPASLAVHDLTGRVVRQLVASSLKPGAYKVTWNGADDRGRLLGNGVYFLKFRAGEYRETAKLVLQR